jgi:hypothetical protein
MSAALHILPLDELHPAWRGLTERDLWPFSAGEEPAPELERELIHSTAPPEPEPRLSELPLGAPTLDHALIYARLGWEIMPRFETQDGRLIDALKGSPRTGLPTVDAVESYFLEHPRTNAIAVVLGPRSGVFVVDVDQHSNDRNGRVSLERLEAEHGRLPLNPCVLSPTNGGRHHYFRWPGRPIRSRAIAPGVEVLAAGAAATLPPSSKRAHSYRWRLDQHLDYIDPPEAPRWLLRLAEPLPMPKRGAEPTQMSDRYVRAAIVGEVERVRSAAPGGRNNALNKGVWALRRFVRSGAADPRDIEADLLAVALEGGQSRREAIGTIRSALRARI